MRVKFIESLSLTFGKTHLVKRSHIFEDVIDLYSSKRDTVLAEYPFRSKFVGERAVDLGGVTRDVFSAFFEEAYAKCFDGSSLLTPSDNPLIDSSTLSTVGTIISHVYLITGMLPVQIAFPCLAAVLLPSVSGVPEEVVIECYIDCLSNVDAATLKESLEAIRRGDPSFTHDLKSRLVSLVSMNNVRQIPTVSNLKRILLGVAKHHFFRRPAAAILELSSGIPEQHKKFWCNMGCGQLYSIYTALQASPRKLLKMIDSVVCMNTSQECVLSYLRQFIGNMRADEVRSFLRFVTGSAVCSTSTIQVTFNMLTGLGRRPIAHTCSYTLEIPATYQSYSEFVGDFRAVLNDCDSVWIMDGI